MPKLIPIGPVDGQNNLALRSHRVTRAAKSRLDFTYPMLSAKPRGTAVGIGDATRERIEQTFPCGKASATASRSGLIKTR